jgi:hypothetical protein
MTVKMTRVRDTRTRNEWLSYFNVKDTRKEHEDQASTRAGPWSR